MDMNILMWTLCLDMNLLMDVSVGHEYGKLVILPDIIFAFLAFILAKMIPRGLFNISLDCGSIINCIRTVCEIHISSVLEITYVDVMVDMNM